MIPPMSAGDETLLYQIGIAGLGLVILFLIRHIKQGGSLLSAYIKAKKLRKKGARLELIITPGNQILPRVSKATGGPMNKVDMLGYVQGVPDAILMFPDGVPSQVVLSKFAIGQKPENILITQTLSDNGIRSLLDTPKSFQEAVENIDEKGIPDNIEVYSQSDEQAGNTARNPIKVGPYDLKIGVFEKARQVLGIPLRFNTMAGWMFKNLNPSQVRAQIAAEVAADREGTMREAVKIIALCAGIGIIFFVIFIGTRIIGLEF